MSLKDFLFYEKFYRMHVVPSCNGRIFQIPCLIPRGCFKSVRSRLQLVLQFLPDEYKDILYLQRFGLSLMVEFLHISLWILQLNSPLRNVRMSLTCFLSHLMILVLLYHQASSLNLCHCVSWLLGSVQGHLQSVRDLYRRLLQSFGNDLHLKCSILNHVYMLHATAEVPLNL